MKGHKTWEQWISECKSIAKQKGITQKQIAEGIEKSKYSISRFFNAKEHSPYFSTFVEIWNYVNEYKK